MRSSFERHGASFSKQPATFENDAAVISMETVDCSQSTSFYFDAIEASHRRRTLSFRCDRCVVSKAHASVSEAAAVISKRQPEEKNRGAAEGECRAPG